jgi:hypothetical protein
VGFRISVVVAALSLTGCNANQGINLSSRGTRSRRRPGLQSLQSHQLRTEQLRKSQWRSLNRPPHSPAETTS